MIHYRKEGDYLKIGLNVTVGRIGWKPWIAFVWCWYSIQEHEMTAKRLRMRTNKWPCLIYESVKRNMTENYLRRHDLIACPRELLEDYAPKLIPLAAYFNQQYKAGEIGRYNG